IAGDAITCWFDEAHMAARAPARLERQARMARLGPTSAPGGTRPPLSLKVGLAAGEARRLVVGDPETQLFDVLSGAVVDRSSAAEQLCPPGGVVADRALAEELRETVAFTSLDDDFVRVEALRATVPADPWPELPDLDSPDARPWLPAPVWERLRAGHTRLLAEFRPVVALFVSFGGIDYDDTDAGRALDAFLRATQETVDRSGGSVFDVIMGDKGSYLLAVFGAPVAHGDDVRRAVTAADELRRTTDGRLRIGLHVGRVFAGLYAGEVRSAYAVVGDVVNLAARLMTSAAAGQVLMSARGAPALDRRVAIQAD